MRLPFLRRLALVGRLYLVSGRISCPHTQGEMLEVIGTLLSLAPENEGVVVEAGCYQGGSTAKLSLAAAQAGRKLVVFDSFQGLPDHHETPAENIFGETVRFLPGEYRAALEDVKANIARFGAPEVCAFRPGWFEETMPAFSEPIALLFLDVDLASSTRTALKHLYPRLVRGGVFFSHDGHVPRVLSVFRDREFWRREVGCPAPRFVGLGRRKLVRAEKTS
ncbi:MAG: class I SAM-dependent methyltransferase [Candidatus Aminicenantes bacterium]|nr:class I SAM-dependent methyltransferase [Candidatus Aminicenantes bacterium]